jgi:hypothetical protein
MAKGKSWFGLGKLRSFWRRTSDGLTAAQLWTEFRRETRSSLDLYSAETGRNLREEWSGWRGRRGVFGAVADAMYKRLTPVRRVLLLLAVALLLLPALDHSSPSGAHTSSNSTLAAVILLVLIIPTSWALPSYHRKQTLHRSLSRMLCCPARSPFNASNRFPRMAPKSVRLVAASSQRGRLRACSQIALNLRLPYPSWIALVSGHRNERIIHVKETTCRVLGSSHGAARSMSKREKQIAQFRLTRFSRFSTPGFVRPGSPRMAVALADG